MSKEIVIPRGRAEVQRPEERRENKAVRKCEGKAAKEEGMSTRAGVKACW